MDDLEKKGVPVHRGREYGLHRVMREVILEIEEFSVENCEPIILGAKDEILIQPTTKKPLEKIRNRDLSESILDVISRHDYPSISQLKRNLGWLYTNLGWYEKAKDLQESVLSFVEEYYEEGHFEISISKSHF